MRRVIGLLTLPLCLCSPDVSRADPPHARGGFSRVYGPAGRATGAHFGQANRLGLSRQFGLERHGRGLTAQGSHHHHHHRHFTGRLPRVYSGTTLYGYSGYGCVGSVYDGGFYAGPVTSGFRRGYWNIDPTVGGVWTNYAGSPPPNAFNPYQNPVIRETLRENADRWGQPIVPDRLPALAPRAVRLSSPEAKIRSLRSEGRGDVWFRKQNYLQAYQRYKQAVAEAGDRAEARFRLAYALTALGRFHEAIRHFKRGLEIDPTWPASGLTLQELFGPENQLAKSSLMHRVADWVRGDIRDPERLFVLGILLHFDENTERAAIVFETAFRLAGRGNHLTAFLRSDQPAESQTPQARPEPALIPPRVIEPQPVPVDPPVLEPKPERIVPPLPAPSAKKTGVYEFAPAQAKLLPFHSS